MDAAAHYCHLLGLGREEFLAAAAPAVLVRHRAAAPDPTLAGTTTLTMTLDLRLDLPFDRPADRPIDHRMGPPAGAHEDRGEAVDEAMPHGKFIPVPAAIELFPLAKKPGASFPDRITIGRTSNNDVVIADASVSRLHAYVRDSDPWVVADAGSKNGSWLDGVVLAPRRETALAPGAAIRFGDVQLAFYRSEDLFELMGGDHGRR
jgi:hypothetical protein